MKVHITLVGGQPAPVYNGIVATEPDKVVYIYSDKTIEEAERISKEVQIPSEKCKLDPVDLNDIEKRMLYLKYNDYVKQGTYQERSFKERLHIMNWLYDEYVS